MTKAPLVLFAIVLSASAFAQDSSPKIGNKPPVLVKPTAPAGCKLVGTVKGTKLWAGDCVESEQLRSSIPAAEPSLPDRAVGAIPPGQK